MASAIRSPIHLHFWLLILHFQVGAQQRNLEQHFQSCMHAKKRVEADVMLANMKKLAAWFWLFDQHLS